MNNNESKELPKEKLPPRTPLPRKAKQKAKKNIKKALSLSGILPTQSQEDLNPEEIVVSKGKHKRTSLDSDSDNPAKNDEYKPRGQTKKKLKKKKKKAEKLEDEAKSEKVLQTEIKAYVDSPGREIARIRRVIKNIITSGLSADIKKTLLITFLNKIDLWRHGKNSTERRKFIREYLGLASAKFPDGPIELAISRRQFDLLRIILTKIKRSMSLLCHDGSQPFDPYVGVQTVLAATHTDTNTQTWYLENYAQAQEEGGLYLDETQIPWASLSPQKAKQGGLPAEEPPAAVVPLRPRELPAPAAQPFPAAQPALPQHIAQMLQRHLQQRLPQAPRPPRPARASLPLHEDKQAVHTATVSVGIREFFLPLVIKYRLDTPEENKKIVAKMITNYEDLFKQKCLQSTSSSDEKSSISTPSSAEELVTTALSLATRKDDSSTCLPRRIQEMREFQVLLALHTLQHYSDIIVINFNTADGNVCPITLPDVLTAVVRANLDPEFVREMIVTSTESKESDLIKELQANLTSIVESALIDANTPETGQAPKCAGGFLVALGRVYKRIHEGDKRLDIGKGDILRLMQDSYNANFRALSGSAKQQLLNTIMRKMHRGNPIEVLLNYPHFLASFNESMEKYIKEKYFTPEDVTNVTKALLDLGPLALEKFPPVDIEIARISAETFGQDESSSAEMQTTLLESLQSTEKTPTFSGNWPGHTNDTLSFRDSPASSSSLREGKSFSTRATLSSLSSDSTSSEPSLTTSSPYDNHGLFGKKFSVQQRSPSDEQRLSSLSSEPNSKTTGSPHDSQGLFKEKEKKFARRRTKSKSKLSFTKQQQTGPQEEHTESKKRKHLRSPSPS